MIFPLLAQLHCEHSRGEIKTIKIKPNELKLLTAPPTPHPLAALTGGSEFHTVTKTGKDGVSVGWGTAAFGDVGCCRRASCPSGWRRPERPSSSLQPEC